MQRVEALYRQAEEDRWRDSLTDLGNRGAFEAALGNQVGSFLSDGLPFALALIDVDDLGAVNQSEGQSVGDDVLQGVAETIQQLARPQDLAYRIGGDEFACVVVGEDGPARMEQAVQALTENFRNAGELDRESPTISIGLVRLPVDRDCTIDEAYKAADNALYECKRAKTSASESSSIVSLDLRGPRVAERPH